VFLINIFLTLNLALAASATPATDTAFQNQIDQAYGLIFKTKIGQTICRDILGSDAAAISLHLGVTFEKAVAFANECKGNFEPSEWVYPTSPSDIEKIAHPDQRPKKYVQAQSSETFPIESWTDPFSNSTTILSVQGQGLEFGRLLQILAHETAVYFDSKTNPAHPNAQSISTLRSLSLKGPNAVNPLVAVSDPLVAHTLTYLRALQVEFSILDELVDRGLVQKGDLPADYNAPDLRYLISDSCGHSCIANLIVKLRDEYLPIALPMLAFANNYRALMTTELPKLGIAWDGKGPSPQELLFNLPVLFRKTQVTGDAITDMSHVFNTVDVSKKGDFDDVTKFMRDQLWPVEWPSVSESKFASGTTLLEFMKRPLLSGYNIMLTSGPRVRVRTGLVQ
jgi:hypothetical protein